MKRIYLALAMLMLCPQLSNAETVTVASKKFTESYVLGEIAKRVLEQDGFTVEHKQGMGAVGIVWAALKSRQISCYPEYTGTVSQEILKVKGDMSPDAMRAALAKDGVGMAGELGFNNTYAIAMRRTKAEKLHIKKISDLKAHPDLIVRPTSEFLSRNDGWVPLSARYGLAMKNVTGMEHSLGYAAIGRDQIDVIDAYSTDAKIAEYDLVTLEDDMNFFPKYRAVFLYRLEMPKKAVDALEKLTGTINEDRMLRLNAEAEKTKDYAKAAALYFSNSNTANSGTSQSGSAKSPEAESTTVKILRYTGRHLQLVGISLLLAILVGIPLGIWASYPGPAGHLILGVTGIIQTIPSLALLMMLIPVPFLGISTNTAIVALFLYSLLPIVRNTATGLQSIPESMRESAAALGLGPQERMLKIYLPMASRTILAGIKTSTIINVGTATLAAFIGAGGLGEPIVSGLNLNDNNTILQGAIPAALLALVVQFGFDLLDRIIIPKGLRLSSAEN